MSVCLLVLMDSPHPRRRGGIRAARQADRGEQPSLAANATLIFIYGDMLLTLLVRLR
jgi:hypothetical protein